MLFAAFTLWKQPPAAISLLYATFFIDNIFYTPPKKQNKKKQKKNIPNPFLQLTLPKRRPFRLLNLDMETNIIICGYKSRSYQRSTIHTHEIAPGGDFHHPPLTLWKQLPGAIYLLYATLCFDNIF